MANVAVSAVNLDELCVNTIRTLSIDAIQQANSGHPGTPMGMAPTVYSLWQRVLRFDPADPICRAVTLVLANGRCTKPIVVFGPPAATCQ